MAVTRHETGIQWTHVPGYKGETWNPTVRVTRAAGGSSPANARGSGHEPPGLLPPQYDLPFSQVQLLPDRLEVPLRARKPRAYFVDSMADLFHEDVPDGYLWAVWETMLRTPQHLYLILTKRPERMRDFVTRMLDLTGESSEPQMVRGPEATRERHPSGRGQLFASWLEWLGSTTGGEPPPGAAWPTFDWMDGPRWWPRFFFTPPNVWLGVSAEDQERLNERYELLADTPAAVRFLSLEPLLGPIALHDASYPDWVIVGGESGRHARPFDLAWARSIVEQCEAAGVATFVKQLGSRPGFNYPFEHGDPWTELALRHPHGGDPSEWPEELRIREWPGIEAVR